MNHKLDKVTPRFDVQLRFEEIGVALDDYQYRDAISLVDMYHVYVRQYQVGDCKFAAHCCPDQSGCVCALQYRKFRPAVEAFGQSRAKARWSFACKAILDGVHERNRKWTWAYFAERRDDRDKYVDLFERKLLTTLTGPVG